MQLHTALIGRLMRLKNGRSLILLSSSLNRCGGSHETSSDEVSCGNYAHHNWRQMEGDLALSSVSRRQALLGIAARGGRHHPENAHPAIARNGARWPGASRG